MESGNIEKTGQILIFPYFLLARLILVLSLPLAGLQSYGDFWNFFQLAGLGLPFRDIWVEFPPVFPFLSRGIFQLSGGEEHIYTYLLVIVFSLFQAGSLYLFQKIAVILWGSEKGFKKTVAYGFMILPLFFGWAYFDCLAVFLTLGGLYLLLQFDHNSAGLALGLGALVKWFPALILPAAWKWLGWRKGLRLVLIAFLLVFAAWGVLHIASPEMARASLVSQGAKGSWESIWAMIDGNLRTGNFPAGISRFDPAAAAQSAGNPPRISPWVTLLFFGGGGAYLFFKANVRTQQQLIAFSGLTFLIFFIWSPGYSPQWVLFLIPLILLSLAGSRSYLAAVLVILVNLLEWPLLLSRGLFDYLPGLIALRTMIYAILILLLAQIVLAGKTAPTREG